MPMIPAPDIWSNPYQRMGYVNVNVLIGSGVEPGDRDLFFGPLHGREVWLDLGMTCPDLSGLLVALGLFSSKKEAARKGYAGRIPEGFSDHIGILRKHRVTILKNTMGCS